MSNIQSYIKENQTRFLDELFGFLRIPSISPEPKHKKDMLSAAEYVRKAILQAGADHAGIVSTDGNPVVYGEKTIRKDKPTILIYGHYDVMPAEPLDLWKSPPFEPEIRDGRIYARGANDDKGQLYMHVKAFEYLVRSRALQCNVRFLIEGEEETGSESLKKFCIQNKEMLSADIILVSDTSMLDEDTPSITVGLRGICYFEVKVSGPNRELHSGLYGGAVVNPANALARIITRLTDEQYRINIPGFYDDVMEIPQSERNEMKKTPFKLEEFKESIGITGTAGEKGYTTLERLGIRPSLDVNGIWGGYTGEGTKTIIPADAYAKISTRLVPNQDPEKIRVLFENYLAQIAPEGVHVTVKYLHGGPGYMAPVNSDAYRAASMAYEKVFRKKPLPVRSGGSIPIIAEFEKILGLKSILMGFGLESDAIHSPNENFRLNVFFKGIETISHFYGFYCA
ncbi:MAG: dipeptidase [Bacteroidales bacterium]|nr:dipeptidase [Bacteroidales bacterium]